VQVAALEALYKAVSAAVAEIVTLAASATPVTFPALVTVAFVVSELVHETVPPPLDGLCVAFSVVVPPTAIVAVVGLSVTVWFPLFTVLFTVVDFEFHRSFPARVTVMGIEPPAFASVSDVPDTLPHSDGTLKLYAPALPPLPVRVMAAPAYVSVLNDTPRSPWFPFASVSANALLCAAYSPSAAFVIVMLNLPALLGASVSVVPLRLTLPALAGSVLFSLTLYAPVPPPPETVAVGLLPLYVQLSADSAITDAAVKLPVAGVLPTLFATVHL
jgi:hypothetical protein